MNEGPLHLLRSLGILKSFSISKIINRKEVTKISKQIKKNYKEIDGPTFQKLLSDALIESTKKYINKQPPPGFIFPENDESREELDRYYMELAVISQALSSKFVEQKLTKDQICFILNATINILGITDEDFESFNKKFQKYKDGDFGTDEEEVG
jgi:hypothetical protein